MRAFFLAPALVLAHVALAGTAAAQSATQTVTFSVSPINALSVSADPAALTVNSATAGSPPNAATNSATSYAITTNETNKKITAAIDQAMPAGLTLQVNLQAPTGATSAGAVTLGTTAADAVTGITKLNESGKTSSHPCSGTTAAGTGSSTARPVTRTIVPGA